MSRWIQRMKDKRESGAALVIAIILLSAVEILGFALITMSQIDYSVAGNVARSEETLYAAEQGVMMAIDYLTSTERPPTLGEGATYSISSTAYQGAGADKYPQWTAVVTFLGEAPLGEGDPPSLKIYRYMIDGTATGVKGVTRRVKAGISRYVVPCYGGYCAKAEGTRQIERDLAAYARPQ